MKPRHHVREDVDGEGQPRPARQRRTREIVDNDDVDLRMIDLDEVERTANRIFARHGHRRLDDIAFAAALTSDPNVDSGGRAARCSPRCIGHARTRRDALALAAWV